MKKAHLGISVGFLAALVYLAAYLHNYVLMALLVGYILLKEDNLWLRKAAVTAVCLSIGVLLVTVVLKVIPYALAALSSLLAILKVSLHFATVNNIFSFLLLLVNYGEKILYLFLGVLALSQRSFILPVVDRFVDKHMSDGE